MLSALFLATVIGISDGDTLTVLNKERQQVSRGMAWVYRKYARIIISLFMNTRQSGKSADCGWIRPLLHRGSGGSPRATQLFGCSLMSDLTKLEQ